MMYDVGQFAVAVLGARARNCLATGVRHADELVERKYCDRVRRRECQNVLSHPLRLVVEDCEFNLNP